MAKVRTSTLPVEPPPHGAEIKKILSGIIGEDNCYFF